MIRRDKRLSAAYALLALNLAVIWGNSLLPGEISAAISGWVRDLLNAPLHGGGASGGVVSGDGPIRKAAHFLEFTCLGLILNRITGLRDKPRSRAVGMGFLVGCVDETIQTMVPDRGPAFTDVILDTSGVLCGVFLLPALWRLGRKMTKIKK